MREICFDVETTGFYAKDGDKIIEIGCVVLPLKKDGNDEVFHTYVNPQRSIPEEVIKVHHITDEIVKDKPVFAEIADEFIGFIRGARLIAHNSSFDVSFLDQELKSAGKGVLSDYCAEVVDSYAIAKKVFPTQKNSLDAVCQRLEVDLSSRGKGHGALVDSKLLAQVYPLLKQKQGSLDMESYAEAGAQAIVDGDKGLVIRADETELAEHEAILDLLAKKCKGTPHFRLTEEEFHEKRQKEQEAINSKRAKMKNFIETL